MSDYQNDSPNDEEDLKQAKMSAMQKLSGGPTIGPDTGNSIRTDVIPEQPGVVEGFANLQRAMQLKGLRDAQAMHDNSRQADGYLPKDYQSPSQQAKNEDTQNMVTQGSLGSGNSLKDIMTKRVPNLEAMAPAKQWTTESLQALKDQAQKIADHPAISQADKYMTFQKLKSALNAAKMRGVKLPGE